MLELLMCTDSPVPIGPLSDGVIPIMTASNQPTGYVVSASSAYRYDEYYSPYCAFTQILDKSNIGWTAKNMTTTTGVTNEWLQIQLPSSVIISRYSLLGSHSGWGPTDYQLMGSVNGSSWSILHTVKDNPKENWSILKEHQLNNIYAYRYYRINITKTAPAFTYANVISLQLYVS